MQKTQAPIKLLNLMNWIKESEGEFHKPVGNKVIWEDSEFIVFVSAGNSRNDFHINPGDEVFLQVHGDVRVDLQLDGKRVINPLREGEMLCIPAFVPHAPRRPHGTHGLVVERKRQPGELDAFAWHCENCNAEIHSIEFQLSDIVGQFGKKLEEFDANEEARTCKECGEVLRVHQDFTMDSQIVPGAQTW